LKKYQLVQFQKENIHFIFTVSVSNFMTCFIEAKRSVQFKKLYKTLLKITENHNGRVAMYQLFTSTQSHRRSISETWHTLTNAQPTWHTFDSVKTLIKCKRLTYLVDLKDVFDPKQLKQWVCYGMESSPLCNITSINYKNHRFVAILCHGSYLPARSFWRLSSL